MSNEPVLLIIDDEELLVETLVDEIQPLGVKCLTATNAKEGILMLERERPDAILSDINMPGMSGLDMLAEVHRRGLHTPLIFLSAYGDKEKVTQALRLGAVDFLEKPYDRDVLKESVKKALTLGVSLRTLDSELESFADDLPEAASERFLEIKRTLLIAKKQSAAYFKKAA